MLAADERAQPRRRFLRVTRLHVFGFALQRRDESVKDGALHIHALGAETDLSGVEKRGARNAFDGGVEIGIGKYQCRVFAAQLQRDRTHAVRGGAHDRFAG